MFTTGSLIIQSLFFVSPNAAQQMTTIIERYKAIIVQLATPYSREGTGFYLPSYDLIVTNEHVVKDNREVILEGLNFERQIVKVLYLDEKYDIAFLSAPKILDFPALAFATPAHLKEGDQVIAIGHPFGMKFSFTRGVISKLPDRTQELDYIVHDAALNQGNSGGPLINEAGDLIGMNSFVLEDSNGLGFALPIQFVEQALKEYISRKGKLAARCTSCGNVIFEQGVQGEYCPICGASITLPSFIKAYEPNGVSKTIEQILAQAGYDVKLARRGLNNWEIQKGSATIKVAYHEDSGLIMGDAYLCLLPKKNLMPLYQFLLQQNMEMEGLNFSVPPNGQEVTLSLLIYDRYLNVDTGIRLFEHLFERADHYDNILIEQYGAKWHEHK